MEILTGLIRGIWCAMKRMRGRRSGGIGKGAESWLDGSTEYWGGKSRVMNPRKHHMDLSNDSIKWRFRFRYFFQEFSFFKFHFFRGLLLAKVHIGSSSEKMIGMGKNLKILAGIIFSPEFRNPIYFGSDKDHICVVIEQEDLHSSIANISNLGMQ